MSREYTREHMIFQLVANSHFHEKELNKMSNKTLIGLYRIHVEEVS